MKWSWRIGKLAGIDIFLHWTFLLLVGWIFVSYIAQGESLVAALVGVGFILALFGCVVLHEMGHALMARHYGVATKDIVLLPIGGVARLQRMPEEPMHELAVAAAGPAVNVVIAAVLAGLLITTGDNGSLEPGQLASGSFLQNLMWVNVGLVLFNLIPAFPMDGGRMLRALLAVQMPYLRATHIAASIGQLLAILFAFAGLFWLGNPFLLFIAIFVYLGAAAEAQLTEVRMLLRGVPASAAMITNFRTLEPHDTLQDAVDQLLSGSQIDFPVEENGTYCGMVRRKDLAAGLQQYGPHALLREIMQTDCPTLGDREMLEQVMEHLQSDDCTTLPVIKNGNVVGLVTKDNLGELIMVRSALSGEGISRSEQLAEIA